MRNLKIGAFGPLLLFLLITSKGSDTKILSREELRDRDMIMKRPDQYTQAEIDAAQVTDEVRGRNFDPNHYKMNTTPIESERTGSRRFDIRTKPEVGD